MPISDQLTAALSQLDAARTSITAAIASLNPPPAPTIELAPLLISRKVSGIVAQTYTVSDSPAVGIGNGGFEGSGFANLMMKPVVGGSSGISVQGGNFTFMNANVSGPSTCVALRVYGKMLQVLNVNFDASLATGVLLDAGSDLALIGHCIFGLMGSESIYVTSDNCTITDCTFAGSQGEHCVRFDVNASTGHRPANGTIRNCTFSNHNPQGKECLTLREADTVLVENCTFDGWVSAGQHASDNVWHARNITFSNCVWKSLRPGGALGEFKSLVNVTLDSCTVPASMTEPAFTVDAGGSITLTGDNKMVVPSGMTSFKPFAMGNVVGLGTVKTILRRI